MFKNKWFVGIFIAVLAIIMYYSLSTELPYNERIESSREAYKQNILSMEDSPIDLDTFEHFEYFSPNEAFVFTGEFTATNQGKEFSLTMTDSTTTVVPLAGTAVIQLEGKPIKLQLFDEGDTYLLPFNDLTNGQETYGGGRYINIDRKSVNSGKITIDFNEAHNFYCAYNFNYICPIPPAENSIQVKISAGEKIYGEHQHD